MPKQIEFEGAVHEFPDDFSDAEIAAALDGGAPETTQAAAAGGMPGTASAVTAGALGLASAAPAIVSGVNMLAKGAGAIANKTGAKYAPGVVALDAAGKVVRGDYKGAATSGVTAAAMSQVPRAAAAVQRSTSPAIVATRNALGRFVTGGKAAGPVMRGAQGLSKFASAAALPLTLLSTYLDGAKLVTQLEDEVAKRHPEVLAQREWW